MSRTRPKAIQQLSALLDLVALQSMQSRSTHRTPAETYLPFHVTVASFQHVHSLDSAWSESAYRDVLELLDFEGASQLPADELREMTMMALQDKEPHEAAEALLRYRLGDRLTPGQRKELSHEMVIDRMWEEHSDMALHEELFHVAGLLDAAMPGGFPEPSATSFVIRLEAGNSDDAAALAEVSEALICRAVAGGLPTKNVLRRLFADQLAGKEFVEAVDIVWSFAVEPQTQHAAVIEGLTAVRWFDGLEAGQAFSVEARNNESMDHA